MIKKLDGIYNFQSSNVKMMALAMSHYLPKNYHPGKFNRPVRVALDCVVGLSGSRWIRENYIFDMMLYFETIHNYKIFSW